MAGGGVARPGEAAEDEGELSVEAVVVAVVAVLEPDVLVLSTRTTAFSNTHLVRLRGSVLVAPLAEGSLTGLTSISLSSRSQRMTLQIRLVGLWTTWWYGC